MRRTEEPESWVVYRMTVTGKLNGTHAVCDQAEWDAMERVKPGLHTLIKAGITNEGEAERLARVGTESEAKPSPAKRAR